MDWEQVLRTSGLDRYDRNARLYPAFLCLLPIFAVVALWLPQAWTLLGGLVSLAVGCGLIFYLAQVVRYLGRRVEAQLGDRVGRARSATLLGHSDLSIPAETKARYHKYLVAHGIDIPRRESEVNDPVAAHQKFRSAVDWLLVHTRKNAKGSLLFSENVAYGFRRNLLGVKPIALPLLILAFLVNGYLIAIRRNQSQAVAADILEVLLSLGLATWIFIVRPSFVEDASLAYAQQFLAQCEGGKAPRKSKNTFIPPDEGQAPVQ